MIQKVNKNAGFWIRLLSVTIDILVFIAIGILSSLICLETKFISELQNTIYFVRTNFTYYLWFLILIILLIILFIFVPFLFEGQTLGMIITRLKIDYKNEEKNKVIFKKIQIVVFAWILIIFLFMIFVRPQTINKMIIFSYVKKNVSTSTEEINNLLLKNQWTTWETISYTIPSSLPSLVLIMDVFLLISSGFKNEKVSILDRITNTNVVWKYKWEEIQINQIIIQEPQKEEKRQIIWKD